MKSYYEKHRDDTLELVLQKNTSQVYPAHFHRNIEICVLKKGTLELSINDKIYRMKSGQIVVIDSFDVHEYINSGDEGFYDCVLVIPYEFLGDLLAQKNGFRIENPIVEDAELCDKIIRLADEFLCEKESISVQKATCKLVWSLLVEKLVFVEEKNRGEVALIRRALIYLQENFKGEVSRKSLAQKLGYAEAHLSRVFNRYLRMGIAEYVNSLRLEYIEQKFAENNGAGLLEVIYDAGFNCPQTYYRAKKKRAEKLRVEP